MVRNLALPSDFRRKEFEADGRVMMAMHGLNLEATQRPACFGFSAGPSVAVVSVW